MKPKILLSANNNKQYYIDAVNSAGGQAVCEYLPEVDLSFDGLILCGGNDIDPKYFGEEINGSVNIDAPRDEAEFKLAKAFIESGKPVMGICRGSQLLNVYFGGSLIQHLPNADIHTNKSDHYITHAVAAEKGSILEKLYGENFCINSSHHQAVDKLGAGLRATAFYENVVEAFEHTSLPVFAVQFHPERMCCSERRPDTANGAPIFEYFINLCKKQK
ncbi:MAG: gamma-glutamyl-gamma-aminobutyrate hydrolase family protein [Oscillospiraceae bacterium]|nr:gamma-glutamyl-gamma-aminobutyrate hydrolase family protein [Oscillospiraceae bacterium]